MKTNNEEIENQSDNFSYNKAIFSYKNSGFFEESIINKDYVGIATGNEAVGNFEDVPSKRTYKNVSEEVMFKIEDEIHEFDSNIAQIKITLNLIGRIQKEKLSQETLARICSKLMTNLPGLMYSS